MRAQHHRWGGGDPAHYQFFSDFVRKPSAPNITVEITPTHYTLTQSALAEDNGQYWSVPIPLLSVDNQSSSTASGVWLNSRE